MKTKYSLGLASLILLIILSCHKENDVLPENARLKQVLLYQNIDAKEPVGIQEEYEYNALGQISKVSHVDYLISGFLNYDMYEYNSIGQLIKITNYYSNVNSPTGYDSSYYKIYNYSGDGKKVKETIVELYGVIKEYSLFIYTDGRLSRIENHIPEGIRGETIIYTLFDYDDYGQPVKEVAYWGNTNEPFKWTINTFSNGLMVKTEVYSDVNLQDNIRKTYRTFDANKNLKILEIYEGPASTSVGGFVGKYIYFGE